MTGPHSGEPRAEPRYLFIVARERHDLLERVQARFAGDPRIAVVVDRRRGERRTHSERPDRDRRSGDRRASTGLAHDLRVYPSFVVQKHPASSTDLETETAALQRRCDDLSAENAELRARVASLEHERDALAAADARRTAAVTAALAVAEQALGVIQKDSTRPAGGLASRRSA